MLPRPVICKKIQNIQISNRGTPLNLYGRRPARMKVLQAPNFYQGPLSIHMIDWLKMVLQYLWATKILAAQTGTTVLQLQPELSLMHYVQQNDATIQTVIIKISRSTAFKGDIKVTLVKQFVPYTLTYLIVTTQSNTSNSFLHTDLELDMYKELIQKIAARLTGS